MGLIGLIIPMEGGGGSEDSHWPPGVHSFDPKPLFPDAGMDWLNTYLLQAVVGAIIVIVGWLWLAKDQKVVPGFKQWCGEQLYNMVRNGIGRDALGYEYKRFTPYLLALFSFILVNNLFGQFFLTMFPTFSRVGYAYGLALLTWLLDSDPALRWRVERDLAGAPRETWAATRESIATEGFGARLLELQVTAQRQNDVAGDGQAKADAGNILIAGRVETAERAECVFVVLGWYAGAGVAVAAPDVRGPVVLQRPDRGLGQDMRAAEGLRLPLDLRILRRRTSL